MGAKYLSGVAFVSLALCATTSALSAESAGNPSPVCEKIDAIDWANFKSHYVSSEGRVIDTGNHGISHSEGQGYALLFAVANNDRQAFDKIWHWTDKNLSRDNMRLFSWRYDPVETPPVADANNATDGDIAIAWALMRASERWGFAPYELTSQEIRHEIVKKLVRRVAGYTLLLPGLEGFEKDGATTINLSYLIFPAFEAFARAEPDCPWSDLYKDGVSLVARARFGAYHLPPDWLRLTSEGAVSVAPGKPARFGFDAIRVPLYLYWGKAPDASLEPFRAYWQQTDPSKAAWVDLETGRTSPYVASAGLKSVAALIVPGAKPRSGGLPEDYYSASLQLLSEMACSEH